MFCSKCGAQVGDARVCSQCGTVLAGPAAVQREVRAQTGRWISEGWRLVTEDLGNYSLITLIYVAINSVASLVTQGPLQTGFHIYTMKKIFRRRADIGDIFKGFEFFLPSFIATILIAVFVFAGTLLCVIPGLIVAAMYKFTYLFILDKKMDFWPAMQASHSVAKNDYFGFTLFLLVLALVNVLGFLCLVVGLLVSIPVSIAAITVAYQECVGFEQRTVDGL